MSIPGQITAISGGSSILGSWYRLSDWRVEWEIDRQISMECKYAVLICCGDENVKRESKSVDLLAELHFHLESDKKNDFVDTISRN